MGRPLMQVQLLREVSLKETLELRVWLHDFGAIEVLRVLGVLVRAHAIAR